MRATQLVKRNLKEMIRDPLSLGLTIGLPASMLLILQLLEDTSDFFSPTLLAPGIVLFGFVMLMFSSAMILARDRETALFSRLLTTPLRSEGFVAAYSLPYLAIAIVQGIVVFAIAAGLGLDFEGNPLLVIIVLAAMATFYVGLGMVLGSLLQIGPLSGAYSVVLLITIFAGAWFDLEQIGGPLQTIQNYLPFIHALDATRQVMAEGATFSSVAGDIYWVLAYTVIMVAAAAVAFQRRMVE